MRSPTPLGEPASPPAWEALARYLAGESSDAEAAQVRAWLDEHPGDAALLRTLDGALDRLALASTTEIDVAGALQQVSDRRDHPDVLPLRPRLERAATPTLPSAPTVRAGRRWSTRGLLRAAAVIVVATTGALLLRSTRPAAGVASADGAGRTYATAPGQRDSVRLPDGSQVVLGPASRLVVAAGYGAPARDVELTGEGYFDVIHDDARTFTVHAGGATVRDVGTTFTVRAGMQGDDARVRVAVRTGAVLLDGAPAAAGAAPAGSRERGVVLHEGDAGVVQADGRTVAHTGACRRGDMAAWTEGRLVFREASLDEVGDALRCWYGLELRVADPAVAGRHLTASFAGDSAGRVLRVLGLALGSAMERRGDTVVVGSVGSTR